MQLFMDLCCCLTHYGCCFIKYSSYLSTHNRKPMVGKLTIELTSQENMKAFQLKYLFVMTTELTICEPFIQGYPFAGMWTNWRISLHAVTKAILMNCERNNSLTYYGWTAWRDVVLWQPHTPSNYWNLPQAKMFFGTLCNLVIKLGVEFFP